MIVPNPYSWTTETARAITHAEQVLLHLRVAHSFQYCEHWKKEMREAELRLAELAREFRVMSGAF